MTEEKKKSWENKCNYAAGIIGIGILIVLAFSGPKLVFKMQDTYQTERIWQGVRNGFDVEAIYGSYGSLRERLTAFAERMADGYEFYVAGTEYQCSAEMLDMLDLVLEQAGYNKLKEYGFTPGMQDVENRGYTVDMIKKYVIYNDIAGDERGGLLISAWYIEFTTRQNVTVKLLADTQTYTIYWAEIVQKTVPSWKKISDSDKMTASKKLETYKVQYGYVDVLDSYDWLDFWFRYFEAGQTSVQTFEAYLAENETENGITQLPYGKQNTLQWQPGEWCVSDDEMKIRFRMGLWDIANLIPELSYD